MISFVGAEVATGTAPQRPICRYSRHRGGLGRYAACFALSGCRHCHRLKNGAAWHPDRGGPAGQVDGCLDRSFRQFSRLVPCHRQGHDARPVYPSRKRKSSGPETTFNRDLTESAAIEAGVLRDGRRRGWCERRQAFGRTVTVKLKFQDFCQITRNRSHTGVFDTRQLIRQTSLEPMRSIYPPEKGIRLVGVTVSNFANGPTAPAEFPLDRRVRGHGKRRGRTICLEWRYRLNAPRVGDALPRRR